MMLGCALDAATASLFVRTRFLNLEVQRHYVEIMAGVWNAEPVL
jgi:hypothetical protein